MKRLTHVGLISLSLLLLGWLVLTWQDQFTGTSKIELTGPTGVPFSGLIMANGHRLEVSGELPWSFQGTNVTRCEFVKANPNDSFHYEFLHESVGTSFGAGDVRPNDQGVKVQLRHRSMAIRLLKRDA